MRIRSVFIISILVTGIFISCGSSGPTVRDPEIPPSVEYSKLAVLERISEALESGKGEYALSLFSEFKEEDREASDIVLLEASVLLSFGRISEANEKVDRLLEEDAQNMEALLVLAIIKRASGDEAAYEKTLEDIVKIDEGNSEALAELGQIAWSKRNYRLAGQYWSKAIDADPINMTALVGRGKLLLREDKPDNAEAVLNTAIAAWPNRPEPYAERARLYRAYDLYPDALADQTKAVSLDPSNYWYLIDRARILIDIGRKEEALTDLVKAQEIDDGIFLSYAYSAGIRDEYGDYALAERDYQRLVTLKPDYYFAYEALGILAMREKRWKDASDAFIKAFEQARESYHYALLIALCMRRDGRDTEAVSFIAQVIRRIDRNKIEWQLLRLFHDMSGDVDIAVRIEKETMIDVKARMLYYLAQYYHIRGNTSLAQRFHLQLREMNVQNIIEWRLNEWALEELKID